MRLISSAILLTTAAGVPAGARMPSQEVTSKPGRLSATAGKSGAAGVRCRLATPSALSLPALNARPDRRHGVEDEIDMPAEQRGDCRRAAGIWHMHDVGPGRELEQFGGEMQRAAVAGAGIGELARIGPEHSDQFPDIGGRKIAAYHENVGKGREQR